MITTAIHFADLPTAYRDLLVLHPPRPIHDEHELEQANRIAEAMAGHDLTPDQADYLDLISDLVDKYDREHHPVHASSSPVEALQALIDAHGMNVTQLGKIIGDKGLASRILRGQREISKENAKRLGEHFKVSPALFI